MAAREPSAHNLKARKHILDTAERIVGTKGFSSVGLKESLAAAGVPKGSFYYYFESKNAFGEAMLENYFERDLSQIDRFLNASSGSARERLLAYWQFFRRNQEHHDPDGKCLAVKLGAEVSDMSEEMRLALKSGTSAILSRLTRIIKEGKADGSIPVSGSSTAAAQTLYQLWMGASVMWKISHDRLPFTNANAATERILSGKPV